jgi:hypothetical protein
MFTLTYIYAEYETSVSSWHIWNDDSTKMIVLPIFQLATRLNSQKPYETGIHNELWRVILYMNNGISNGYLKYPHNENEVFYFISCRYTIIDHQTP